MNNVVYIDFGKKNAITQQEVPGIAVDPSLTAYLNELRANGIDEDDIIDVLNAIEDVSCYFLADEVIKQFADGWFEQIL